MIWKDLKICLYPQEIVWGDKEANFARLEEVIRDVHPETDLLILPETFSTGFPVGKDKEEVRPEAERNSGETVERLKRLADQYKMAIAGSFVADTGGSLYNRAFFIEPSGEETFEDKRHLFTMAGEDKVFSRGYKRMSVRYRGWNLAMVICYDIRFPIWCRNNNNEYDALIAVANWPEVRVGAWNALLPARAIENEAYVCGVDCRGVDDKGFSYDGSSAVYDFKGRDISVKGPKHGLIYATLSRERLDAFREKFPAWKDAENFKITE
jgi:predicted amidohydrolase